MTIRPIVICGDPVLHNPTEPVTETPEQLAELIADMYETLDASHGVGLSANQIGVSKRIFVFDCPDPESEGTPSHRGCVINPILETGELPTGSPHKYDDSEGCLSVPGYDFPTSRANWAKVTGTDEHGNPVTWEGRGFFARMLQHEVGHLDGFLYTDMLTGKWAKVAKKKITAEGWTKPGFSWTPGVDPDPFGHDDD